MLAWVATLKSVISQIVDPTRASTPLVTTSEFLHPPPSPTVVHNYSRSRATVSSNPYPDDNTCLRHCSGPETDTSDDDASGVLGCFFPRKPSVAAHRPRSLSMDCARHLLTLKEGYLYKKGAKRRNWKLRWFRLHKTRLSYHRSKKTLDPRGVVNLKECTNVHSSEYKPHCFVIVCSQRVYYICASSNTERDEWISAVTSACERLKTS